MSSKKKDKPSKKIIIDGIGLSIAMIIAAVFLYLTPSYLGSEIVTIIISSILVSFGISGLGMSLTELNNGESIGIDRLGLGVAMLIIWGIVYYFSQYIWLNWALLIVLGIGLFGTATGITILFVNVLSSKSKREAAIKIPVALIQIATTIVALYEIFTKLKIFK
ncbi:hypothetical protein ACQKFG_02315 [Peribacillus sp. NPDC076916]|uniref:hypothetical protein n=1 Tax=Peribacillus sp. NPDC076916 TaxID=3390608 RepID=UPI003D0451C1